GDVEQVGARSRPANGLARELHGPGTQGRPVVDDDAQVVERVLELLAQHVELGVALPVDLYVQVRLGDARRVRVVGAVQDLDEAAARFAPHVDARVQQEVEIRAATGEHHR